jgi:hypothetical protein
MTIAAGTVQEVKDAPKSVMIAWRDRGLRVALASISEDCALLTLKGVGLFAPTASPPLREVKWRGLTSVSRYDPWYYPRISRHGTIRPKKQPASLELHDVRRLIFRATLRLPFSAPLRLPRYGRDEPDRTLHPRGCRASRQCSLSLLASRAPLPVGFECLRTGRDRPCRRLSEAAFALRRFRYPPATPSRRPPLQLISSRV